jgi:predicted Zn-dependent protease
VSNRHLLKNALAHLELAADASPDKRRYRVAFGEALLASGDDAAAEREFAAAAAMGSSGRACALLGVVRARLGDANGAVAAAEEAMSHHGPFPLALYARALGRALLGLKDASELDLREAARRTTEPNLYGSEAERLSRNETLEGRLQPPTPAFLKRVLSRSRDLVRDGTPDENDA